VAQTVTRSLIQFFLESFGRAGLQPSRADRGSERLQPLSLLGGGPLQRSITQLF